ncbi:hypothetical protein DPMN_127161 [Dreissena polymorpha]|uniref:Uncharacterized protein n=1 Tax=Dreissena polymorpha TaxID=45954 RepID=A0A9D4H4Q5_DREPO|nr:hypothetical protein DPMN_127161 [Dreissena polymorpha]
MPAGVYIYDALVTSQSDTVVWSVSSGIENCAPIIRYDVEAQSNFRPGEWRVVVAGRLLVWKHKAN